jgi:hypothetical protein
MISLVLSGLKALILISSPMRWLIFVEILFKWSDQVRFSEKDVPMKDISMYVHGQVDVR